MHTHAYKHTTHTHTAFDTGALETPISKLKYTDKRRYHHTKIKYKKYKPKLIEN